MRLSIVTFHRAFNCGARLQAWALRTVLERMGHEVAFAPVGSVGCRPTWIPLYRPGKGLRRILWGLVANLFALRSGRLIRHRFADFSSRYLPEWPADVRPDGAVFGSDQIWNPRLAKDEQGCFLGEELPPDVRAWAYAASAGDKPLTDADVRRLNRSVRRFEAVSVREQAVADVLDEPWRTQACVVADPVLLVEPDDCRKIAAGVVPAEDYVFCYVLKLTPDLLRTARALASRLNCKLVIAENGRVTRWGAAREVIFGVSPDRFVRLVDRARFVLTTSFHGTALSVALGRPFLSFGADREPAATRVRGLLGRLGLLSRLVGPSVPLEEIESRLQSPWPADLSRRLSEWRESSRDWLRRALEQKDPAK